jgi:hypothetical protein
MGVAGAILAFHSAAIAYSIHLYSGIAETIDKCLCSHTL